MANIIDQIFQGVILPAQNEALSNLTKVFGEQMLGTNGGAASMLVKLSVTLNPLYIGLLFMILAYIGVGGVVRTAMDGKFLGRNWSGFGVPASFMMCIVLLSPIPTQSGATMGQVMFVKSVKFGSNAADFLLMKVFEVSAAADFESNPDSYNLIGEQIPQVNEQMKSALAMYMCGEQLKQMGYGTKVNFFVTLNEVCGLPGDMVGDSYYESYYTLGSAAEVAKISAEMQKWSTLTGVTLPSPGAYSTTGVKNNAASKTQVTKQLECHFRQFREIFQVDVPGNIASTVRIPVTPAIGKVTGLNGQAIPNQLNNRVLPMEDKAMGALWSMALHKSYLCLMQEVFQGKIADKYTAPQAAAAVPWRAGWSNAALALSDELSDYKSSLNKGSLPLSMEVVKSPNPALLGDSLMDKRNAAIITKMVQSLEQYTANVNSQPNSAAQLLAQNLSAGNSANGGAAATGNAVDYARIGLNVVLPAYANAAQKAVTAGLGQGATIAQAEKAKKTLAFMNNIIGKSSLLGPMALGKITKVGAQLFAMMGNLNGKREVADESAKLAAAAAPLGSGLLITAVKGAVNFAMPGPTVMMGFSIALVFMNVVVLLPQVIMLVVMLIWLVKAAVWFMIIPLATVLIALPGTRVGHDIWKSALAIILTPLLALIFYLISLFIFDQMYATVLFWVFEPIIRAGQDGLGWGLVEVLKQIFTGELIFRVLAGVVLFVAVTVYMSMLILKGPDLVTQSLGLRGSSGDLGDEFSQLRGKLDPAGRMFR